MFNKVAWALFISVVNIIMVATLGAPDWGMMAVGVLTYNIWMSR